MSMDIGDFVKVVAVLFVIVVGAVTLVKLAHGPLAQALARRIAGGADQPGSAELAELREQVEELRLRLADTQERLDFAERMLAASREPGRLRDG